VFVDPLAAYTEALCKLARLEQTKGVAWVPNVSSPEELGDALGDLLDGLWRELGGCPPDACPASCLFAIAHRGASFS
jgi:hypothetical protein